MGIFGKLKNIFYDDEYVEEPEENVSVEGRKPKIEELKVEERGPEPVRQTPAPPVVEAAPKTQNTFTERELFKPEKTFNFTEFDDEEEEVKPRVNVMDLERRSRSNNVRNNINLEPATPKVETPKVFKPSPVISPIYGILDKDYKKEEVREKSNHGSVELSSQPRSYDTVRKKAYGTLEDTLADTMVKVTTTDITAVVKDISNDVEKLEKTAKLEDIINEIEKNADMTIGDLEEKASEENFKAEETSEVKVLDDKVSDKTMTDNTLEHDLFNLIDSIYDDKED